MDKRKKLKLNLYLEKGLLPSDYYERDITGLEEFMDYMDEKIEDEDMRGENKENVNKDTD